MKTICFYSGLSDQNLFNQRGWYQTDLRILQELGLNVHVSKSRSDVPTSVDGYFVWWPTTGVIPLMIAKLGRKPVIMIAGGSSSVSSYNGHEEVFGFQSKPFWKRAAVRLCLTRSDVVVGVSRHMALQARRLGATDVRVVYHGIDTGLYRPTPAPAERGRYLAMIVGWLEESRLARKPVAPVLRALALLRQKHPDLRLVVVGRPGTAEARLRELVWSLGLANAVDFKSSISNEEKLELLQNATAYIQPTRHEGFGLAIAEAMACGIPVVVSPVAAVPEVVGNTALLFQPDDDNELAAVLSRILDDPQLAASLSQRGRDRVLSHFTHEHRREGMRAVLQEAGLLRRASA